MKVCSNASPLINLARIGQLELLRILYGRVTIPEAVWQEVVIEGAGQPGAGEVKASSWIAKQSVANIPLVHALRQELDSGESEAIVLALETEADLLLMDERIGRETALHLNVPCMGLIGVLLEAKHQGIIDAVKPHLYSLRNLAGFRISEALYARVLRDQKEI